jgi:hypothetical protein
MSAPALPLFVSVYSTPRRTQGVKREHLGSSTMYQPARSRPRHAPVQPTEDVATDTDEFESHLQRTESSQIYSDIVRGDIDQIAAEEEAQWAPALYHDDADDEDDGEGEGDFDPIEDSRATSEGPLDDNASGQLPTRDQHKDSDGSESSDGHGDINGSEPGDGDTETNVSGEGALNPAPERSR